MKPLITGTTNIIAIDGTKKESFVQKYNAGLAELKKSNPVQEQPVLPQEPINFGGSSVTPSAPVANESLTNAEVLSQSFGSVDFNPVKENNQQASELSSPQKASELDLTEIVYDIAKIQDNLDKIMAKILTLSPDKNIDVNTSMNEQLNTPISEEVINTPQNATSSLLEEAPAQEIAPFVPSNGNIFDEPQGPSLAA